LTIGIVLYLFAANFFERVIEKFSVTRAAKRLRRATPNTAPARLS